MYWRFTTCADLLHWFISRYILIIFFSKCYLKRFRFICAGTSAERDFWEFCILHRKVVLFAQNFCAGKSEQNSVCVYTADGLFSCDFLGKDLINGENLKQRVVWQVLQYVRLITVTLCTAAFSGGLLHATRRGQASKGNWNWIQNCYFSMLIIATSSTRSYREH